MLKAATKLDARYCLAITDDDDEKVKINLLSRVLKIKRMDSTTLNEVLAEIVWWGTYSCCQHRWWRKWHGIMEIIKERYRRVREAL